jgi:hypothetical protein
MCFLRKTDTVKSPFNETLGKQPFSHLIRVSLNGDYAKLHHEIDQLLRLFTIHNYDKTVSLYFYTYKYSYTINIKLISNDFQQKEKTNVNCSSDHNCTKLRNEVWKVE